MPLTSSENRFLRQARALVKPRERDKTGLYRLEGPKLISDAFASGAPIEYVLYAPGFPDHEEGCSLLERLRQRQVPCFEVDDRLWGGLSSTVTPQGILAVVHRYEPSLDEVLGNCKNGLFLVLDAIQDPGNAGTLLRTAAASGCVNVVALKGTVDLYGDKALRAASGAQFYLRLITRVDPENLVNTSAEAGFVLALAVPSGGEDYTVFDWNRPLGLVLGNEGQGARPELKHGRVERVSVYMERGESLNVGIAGGILLFEARRRRLVRGNGCGWLLVDENL